jgi:hypothetical protein
MSTLSILLSHLPLYILAYIDPGTGSIILQALVAVVVGAGVFAKLFWHRILQMLGIRKETNPEEEDEEKAG